MPHRRQSKFLPDALVSASATRCATFPCRASCCNRDVNLCTRSIRSANLPMQHRPNQPLQRLKKKNQHKQQHAAVASGGNTGSSHPLTRRTRAKYNNAKNVAGSAYIKFRCAPYSKKFRRIAK